MAAQGKGLGLVLKSRSGSGTVRLAPREHRNHAVIELLDATGSTAQIHLSANELRVLALRMMKVAAHLQALNRSEEVTQP